jgi:hypothetical protein
METERKTPVSPTCSLIAQYAPVAKVELNLKAGAELFAQKLYKTWTA